MSDLEARIAQCADRLYEARRDRRPIAPVRGDLPEMDIEAAYAVQRINVRRRLDGGSRQVGRKVGLTSLVVQKQLGVDQPDFGALFDDTDYGATGAEMSVSSLVSPRIEAEIAFRLGADITEPPASIDAAAAAVADVAAAMEIVDSAIADWKISIIDTVADNASGGGFLTGPWRPYSRDLDLPSKNMRLTRDGIEICRGSGAASLGDPLNALAWLASTAIAIGEPLRAGEVILSGALGPMAPLVPGRYVAEIDGFDALHLGAKP